MPYVAVKGGEQAIVNSQKLLAEQRRGDRELPAVSTQQIAAQFQLGVDRVMTEGSVYDRGLAALALKQAQGDAVEAIFLLRAYRTSLPRIATSKPIETAKMAIRRRISATFKDLPGGQVLGATHDYTHRLLDFALAADGDAEVPSAPLASQPLEEPVPRVMDILAAESLLEPAVSGEPGETFDLTRTPMSFPAGRDQRLQCLVRGDEGFLLGLAYSTARGYGMTHPFVGEMRFGEVEVEIVPEELGFAISVADIEVTECQMINQFQGQEGNPPQFTRGYGLTFGHCERKAMCMAFVDRSMRTHELGEEVCFPAQDEQFVMSHADSVEASGLINHFKLPHYVDFQSELQLLRRLRAEYASPANGADIGKASSSKERIDASV